MTKYTLAEIVEGIKKGIFKEGDTFETGSGFKVIYKNGILSWMTFGGYLGAAVTVTDENAAEEFTHLAEYTEKKMSFVDALPLIAENKKAKIDFGHEVYEVSCLDDIDSIIEDEFFADLYEADVYVEERVESAEVVNNRLTTIKPIVTTDLNLSNDWLVKVVEEINKIREEKEGRKLTASDVYNIHHMYHFCKDSTAKIADKYGITVRMVNYILNGERWADIYKQFHEDYDIVNDDWY